MPDESEVHAFQVVDLREPGGASRGGPGKRAGMSIAEVRLALAECGRLPEGRPKAQRLESLAAEVRRTGDGPLEAEVLLALSRAYEYSAERERMAVPFARLLQLLDRFPADLGPMSLTIHWQLKWMTVGLIRNPAVPLETAQRWLDELGNRYRQRGFSPRPVHMLRWLLAQGSGDEAAAAAEVDAWITAPRDQMADCQACERNDWGTWRAYLGDDSGALGYWAPLLDGELKCAEEPHRVLAKALLPLVRTGRAEDARDAFLRGYPLARHNISLCAAVGGYIEFCALTGNEARGLEILAEHTAWLADTQLDTADRLAFLTGVTVLLRRLEALGYGSLPVGPGTVAGTTPVMEAEVRELCSRYDARNRSMTVSARIAAQLAQKPLLERLPLGLPTPLPPPATPPPPAPTLPAVLPASAPPPVTAPPAAPPSTGPKPSAPSPAAAPQSPGRPAAALGELVAEARRLSEARHPHARQAWDKVAACGQDLPPDVAARVARSQASALLPGDPKAAYPALLAAATRFAGLGDLARTYEARGCAAIAQALAGQREEGAAAAVLVVAEAGIALAAGTLTPGEHLAVRVAEPAIVLERLAATPERAPADVARGIELVTAALAAAEQAGEPRYAATFHEMLAQLAAWQDEPDALTAHLDAARVCYLEAGEPWRAAVPEGTLGHLALQGGDPKAAETRVREAVAHGGDLLEPGQAAQLASLLAEATGAQPGRERDFVDASLSAAAAWAGISEPDTLHNTFNAARGYGRLGRHAEAAALFAEVMPHVDVPYAPPVIAVTREQYGRSLTGTGQHTEAAREFLEAARLVQDDADQAVHARLAGAAAEALQRAGQNAEALAAYQRAAQLFGDLGHVVARIRCLRSAAWLQFEAAHAGEPDGEVLGVATMRAVLTELESLPADSSPPELDTELAATRTQLDQMLAPPQADPRLTPTSSGQDEDGGEPDDEDGGEPGLPGAA
jgi:tetratricopeptide (TPR) repeat protein